MPKIFAITPVRSRLTLDAKGQGRVTFNIANTSSNPLRGRVTPVALQSARSEWLSVEGESERSFSAEQTHQFTVLVSAPPGTQPGEYSLRLDCLATHNPDELFTEGPVVAFEMSAAEEPKPFPWWIVAAAALLLVVAGAVWWFGFRDTGAQVPRVAGLSVEKARDALEGAGLSAAEQLIEDFTLAPDALPEGVDSFPPKPGTVLRSDPPAGAKVAPGSRIQLTVEGASVAMPRLLNLTTESALNKIVAVGLTLKGFRYKKSAQNQIGRVVDQDPPPDTRVPQGAPVEFAAGSGPRRAFDSLAEAKSAGALSQAEIKALIRATNKKANSFESVLRSLDQAQPNQD